MRPGRFELCIHIPSPREKDREAIIKIYEQKFQITLDEDVREYAVQKTGGFVDDISRMRYSGDHLYAMMRALKREELRRNEGPLSPNNEDIDAALSRTGDSKKKLQKKEEDTIAVHESGHAILAYVLPNCPTIEKITIATGEEETLGYVLQAVKKNKYITTEEELRDDICVMLGGREAERQLLGKISVGAYSDLQRANEVARMMVEELGMSASLGARTFNEAGQGGASTVGAKRRPVAEETAREIDLEIQKILDFEWVRAKEYLDKYQSELNALREKLLEDKTLGLKELKEIFGGEEFKPE